MRDVFNAAGFSVMLYLLDPRQGGAAYAELYSEAGGCVYKRTVLSASERALGVMGGNLSAVQFRSFVQYVFRVADGR